MTSREILIYYSLKYKGDWREIERAILEKEEIEDEKGALKQIGDIKSHVITCLDDGFPDSLKNINFAPFVLYYHGDISLLKSEHILGVVGSRHPSEYGLTYTKSFVEELSKDFVIVSGLAIGIDACAHRSCIENNGKTIAVLGCGINLCYLKCNLDIYWECRKNHLVISEYPDMVEPNPKTFPIRNRIIAGLSDVLFVPEGSNQSGTKITALLMAEKNGNVCCLPTRIDEDSICNTLIASGAYLVEKPLDIYEVVHLQPSSPIFEK